MRLISAHSYVYRFRAAKDYVITLHKSKVSVIKQIYLLSGEYNREQTQQLYLLFQMVVLLKD